MFDGFCLSTEARGKLGSFQHLVQCIETQGLRRSQAACEELAAFHLPAPYDMSRSCLTVRQREMCLRSFTRQGTLAASPQLIGRSHC